MLGPERINALWKQHINDHIWCAKLYSRQQARAAYLAICLDMVDEFRSKDADGWKQALDALEEYPKLLDVLFNKSPGRAGDKLRVAVLAAGLKKP